MTWEDIRGWLALAVGAVSAFVGYRRWKHYRDEKRREAEEKAEAAREARWMMALTQVHDRVSQHDQANREQVTKHHSAILDIYQKHEKTQQAILAAEIRAGDRFEKLLAAISGSRS